MELGVFDPWKIIEYNNNFACPVNHQYAQSTMMSHPTKMLPHVITWYANNLPIRIFHMSSNEITPCVTFLYVSTCLHQLVAMWHHPFKCHVDIFHCLIKFHVSLGDVPHRT
jgi:hypothetical protein